MTSPTPPDDDESDSLLITRHGHVTVLTLNRPHAMNSIDPQLAGRLRQAWADLAADAETWVVVVTGTGNRAFCAGADLKKTPPPPQSFAQSFLSTEPGVTDITPPRSFPLPIIGALNGHAVGGGLELALSFDIQIAADHIRLGLPETKIGSMPGAGGTQRLVRRVPMGIAQRMVLSAELIDAPEALRLGLVSEVVAGSELLDAALRLAERIAANAPLAVRAAKRALYAAEDMPLDRGLEHEQLLWGTLRDTADRAEGRQAFAEKRPPRYQGR